MINDEEMKLKITYFGDRHDKATLRRKVKYYVKQYVVMMKRVIINLKFVGEICLL